MGSQTQINSLGGLTVESRASVGPGVLSTAAASLTGVESTWYNEFLYKEIAQQLNSGL